MKTNFEIRNHPFSIRYRNRELYAYYDHYLMYFDLRDINKVSASNSWSVERITEDNIDACTNETFSVGRMKRYLREQSQYVEGYLARCKKSGKPAGFMWIMYPGGNEFQYRVRRVDAFIFDVYVFSEYRGRGLCGQMFQHVFELLRNNSKSVAALGVRTDNQSAIQAYQKAGGVIKSRRRYIQLCHRYDIPYYSV